MQDGSDLLTALLPPLGQIDLRLSPSALGRFISFEQCQRVFRLDLYSKQVRQSAFNACDVDREWISPVLSTSGREWEQDVHSALQTAGWTTTLVDGGTPDRKRPLNYAVALTSDGDKRIVLQSEVSGNLDGWSVECAKPDLVVIDKTDPQRLRLLVADLKSSRSVKLEHRLQVAIYAMVVAQLFPDALIEEAIIYREPIEPRAQWTDEQLNHCASAKELLNIDSGMLLALAQPAGPYHEQIERTVLRSNSVARRIAAAPFQSLPFHLTSKCDTCEHNQFCIRSARDTDDLSLVPYLVERDKRALRNLGLESISELRVVEEADPTRFERLMATPSLGAHMGELVQRANAFAHWQSGDAVDTLLPDSGYSTLPMASPEFHANLIRIFIDVQRDLDQGRVYLLGALVSCLTEGSDDTAHERSVVHLADRPVEDAAAEATLVTEWVKDVLCAVNDLMTPGNGPEPEAPIHFYFWDDSQMTVIQDLVNRQHGAIIGIDAILALMMQKAAFDTNNFSIVSREIQHQRALPMLCQSLYSVSRWFGFDWPDDIRETFKVRQFDALRRESQEQGAHLVPDRARFNSEIPTEYVHLAWGAATTEDADSGPNTAPWSFYRKPTLDELRAFQHERLIAMQFVTRRLRTNKQTAKTPFSLAVLSQLRLRPASPIEAVREFLAVERHIELSEWRQKRSYSIDRRILLGETLLGRYRDEDQDPDVRILMRQARQRYAARQALGEERFKQLTPSPKKEYSINLTDQRIRLRMDESVMPVSVRDALQLNRRKEGELVVVAPATSVDSRLDPDEQTPFQTTAKQILYANRAKIDHLSDEGTIEILLRGGTFGMPGFVWNSHVTPFEDGDLYTVDDGPDSWIAAAEWKDIERIRQGTSHSAYNWLAENERDEPTWPDAACKAQWRYQEGLNRFPEFDSAAPRYELEKQKYIGRNGDAPMLLVQGPPGTGKSTTSGHAILARIQGALAAGLQYRVAVACKTHSATDVLLGAIMSARAQLKAISLRNPRFFSEHFDSRLLDVPLYRSDPREDVAHGILVFKTKSPGAHLNELQRNDVVVVGGTTNSLGKLTRTAWTDGDLIWDLIVLDEASQMSVPGFLTASNGLKMDGRIVIVGDHRQMPPIVHQKLEDAESETLDPYGMYRSLFDVVRREERERIDIKFQESFRIHRDVAEFLRREVYEQDGIPFYSRKNALMTSPAQDAFANAVVSAPYPLILVVHSEDQSQQRNVVEQELTERILYALRESESPDSIGVVVPHVAQRVELRASIIRNTNDSKLADSVDTVERFQGNEREVIVVSVTESDPAYLRDTSDFIFDPRRLTVAISRARKKLIVIAAESVFDYLPTDEESMINTAIWRNLREKVCTIPLWSGAFEGHRVEVSASRPLADEKAQAAQESIPEA